MAEVLGVVASGISVAQMAVQLLGCIEQLRTLCRSIRDAPQYLQSTLKEIETLGLIFAEIESLDKSSFPVRGSNCLQASLKECQAAVSALESLTTRVILPLNRKGKMNPGNLLKAVLKKEEIRELKVRIDSAKSSLQLAMTCYSAYNSAIRLEKQSSLLEELSARFSSSSQAKLCTEESDYTPLKPRKKKPALMNHPKLYQERLCSLNRCCCSCHDATSLQGRSWFLKGPSSSWFWKQCDKMACRNTKNASLWISLTPIGVPLAFCFGFEIMLSTQHSRITPSLSFQRVVPNTSPGFTLLWELETGQKEDWEKAQQELVELFDSGKASPRDVDRGGRTWLEKLLRWPWILWRRDIQFALFDMLVEMGTQLNTPKLLYQSVQWIGEGPHMALIDDLISCGFDASEIGAPSFSQWPEPCSPNWLSEEITEDPFFVDWISLNSKVCPGFAGLNPLLEAILIDSNDEVKRLLSKFPVNDQDNLLGQSALHLAVSRPQHLELLLESGANVNAKDRHGITPLMYASATGNSHVAIRLLESGADPFLRDGLRNRNFLTYASARGNWTTIMKILGHIHQSAELYGKLVQYWLTFGAVMWVTDDNWKKDLKHFHILLEMGADPNILYQCGPDEPSTETLAHMVRDEAEMKALISHGFVRFNDLDRTGAHALISGFKRPHNDPGVLELLLNGGSIVNHQNHDGHTALHMAADKVRNFSPAFRSKSYDKKSEDWDCNNQRKILQCVRVLLDQKADPCLGDKCRCPCSWSGCTPLHIIANETHNGFWHVRNGIWVLEFLDIVKEIKGFEVAKQCLLDLLRLVKFQELEMTHTCHREIHSHHAPRFVMEDEEIDEILDEEKELASVLEQEMQDIEKIIGSNFEQLVINAVFQLSLQSAPRRDKPRLSKTTNLFIPCFKINYWRDEFVDESILDLATDEIEHSDTVELVDYAGWVNHQHSKHLRQNKPDDEWYSKRKKWILTIRSMNEKIEIESGETFQRTEKGFLEN